MGAVLDHVLGASATGSGIEGINVEFSKLQGDVITDLVGSGGASSSSSSSSSIRVAVDSSGARRIIGLKESRFRNAGEFGCD